jgi:glutamate/tyrosine decarboxylase-like PLP-dependent enzyme
MGGFLLPFLERAGMAIPPFDFRVPGVTSMSADVHKYGYANKGVSDVLYRDTDLQRRQAFVFSDWLGGFYASSGVAGSKATSPFAAAWAILHHLGEDGYVRLATEAFAGRVALETGVRAIPGLTGAILAISAFARESQRGVNQAQPTSVRESPGAAPIRPPAGGTARPGTARQRTRRR